MYELINPLATTGVTLDRASGTFSGGIGAQNLVVRTALGRLSFEGLAVYDSGVVYYGDELRPGGGNPGGSIFKFVPTARAQPPPPPPLALWSSLHWSLARCTVCVWARPIMARARSGC